MDDTPKVILLEDIFRDIGKRRGLTSRFFEPRFFEPRFFNPGVYSGTFPTLVKLFGYMSLPSKASNVDTFGYMTLEASDKILDMAYFGRGTIDGFGAPVEYGLIHVGEKDVYARSLVAGGMGISVVDTSAFNARISGEDNFTDIIGSAWESAQHYDFPRDNERGLPEVKAFLERVVEEGGCF